MKMISQLFLAVLPWLLFVLTSKGFCMERVDCQWGPFGDWSECDGCTKLQTRSRAMAVYAQFGGNPCDGARTETRSCETTKSCPLEDGCGDWFRCGSGKCVSRSLVCNGDVDCEGDALDERSCDPLKAIVCQRGPLPPNIDLLGLGFDVVTGKWRAGVINTNTLGGQCKISFHAENHNLIRIPLSLLKYSFVTTAQNDVSDEVYSSKWHYAKDIVNREKASGTTSGFNHYDFHEKEDRTQTHKLVVLRTSIETAQFQSNSPQYVLISQEFWKALAKLPSVYDYAAYRKVLEMFGTHYVSEGSLGGSFKVVASFDEETLNHMVSETSEFDECERTKRWFLFFPITSEKCTRGQSQRSSSSFDHNKCEVNKVDVEGGGIEHMLALKGLTLSDPNRNWELYSNWADSVQSFPKVTKQKLRPLSELVKEVQCAGLKKLYLRRAIDQYLSESDPCHCRPCRNNGLVVMDGDECKCICKPGTSGQACEQGTEAEGQQGVIHGSWACWSTWSSCSGDRRTRSRSCANPAPQSGGQDCIGEATETSDCEDQHLQHLKTMEPECFDRSLPPSRKCGTPPALINGYILDPKDVYLVGSKVEYTCTGGLHLLSFGLAECTADLTWFPHPGLCAATVCRLESLNEDVIASPLQNAYLIGEEVLLSCPPGKQLVGESRSMCDSSRNFSPNLADIRCVPVAQQQILAPLCRPWEKSIRGKCVCKMPYECSSSLELCGVDAVGTAVPMTACKLHAMECLGKKFGIVEDIACLWPERNMTGCRCHMWETCDGKTHECRCKDSADCPNPGIDVCVRVGEDPSAAAGTMSECEAGLKRCKGEKVTVVSALPCPT